MGKSAAKWHQLAVVVPFQLWLFQGLRITNSIEKWWEMYRNVNTQLASDIWLFSTIFHHSPPKNDPSPEIPKWFPHGPAGPGLLPRELRLCRSSSDRSATSTSQMPMASATLALCSSCHRSWGCEVRSVHVTFDLSIYLSIYLPI